MSASFSAIGVWNALQYRLHRHYLGGWTLARWIVLALLAAPVLAIPTGREKTIALAVVSLTVLLAIRLTRRRGYVRFDPTPDTDADITAIPPQALPFDEKLSIRLTGTLAVSGMARHMVNVPAQYQTFQTRERVLMAQIAPHRWLHLFPVSGTETGWWYAFFTPDRLQRMEAGRLHFGRHPHPAFRLTLAPKEPGGAPVVFYISTPSPRETEKLLADLKADRPEIF